MSCKILLHSKNHRAYFDQHWQHSWSSLDKGDIYHKVSPNTLRRFIGQTEKTRDVNETLHDETETLKKNVLRPRPNPCQDRDVLKNVSRPSQDRDVRDQDYIPEKVQITCFKLILDACGLNCRLHKMNKTPNPNCKECNEKENLTHFLIDCKSQLVENLTRKCDIYNLL
jgi:hypothetical protein